MAPDGGNFAETPTQTPVPGGTPALENIEKLRAVAAEHIKPVELVEAPAAVEQLRTPSPEASEPVKVGVDSADPFQPVSPNSVANNGAIEKLPFVFRIFPFLKSLQPVGRRNFEVPLSRDVRLDKAQDQKSGFQRLMERIKQTSLYKRLENGRYRVLNDSKKTKVAESDTQIEMPQAQKTQNQTAFADLVKQYQQKSPVSKWEKIMLGTGSVPFLDASRDARSNGRLLLDSVFGGDKTKFYAYQVAMGKIQEMDALKNLSLSSDDSQDDVYRNEGGNVIGEFVKDADGNVIGMTDDGINPKQQVKKADTESSQDKPAAALSHPLANLMNTIDAPVVAEDADELPVFRTGRVGAPAKPLKIGFLSPENGGPGEVSEVIILPAAPQEDHEVQTDFAEAVSSDPKKNRPIFQADPTRQADIMRRMKGDRICFGKACGKGPYGAKGPRIK